MVDFHQRFTFADALRGCRLIEEFEPYLVEDPVQTDSFLQDIPKLRSLTSVPLAAGEEWGARWDFHRLVENHDLDFVRCSLPNVGGITEMIRICALCETHDIGIVPHFTGPDRHGRADPHAGTVSAVRRLRIQLRDAAHPVSERVPDVQGRQAVRQRPAGPRRHGEHGSAEAGRHDLRAGAEPADLLPAGRLAVHLVTDGQRPPDTRSASRDASSM